LKLVPPPDAGADDTAPAGVEGATHAHASDAPFSLADTRHAGGFFDANGSAPFIAEVKPGEDRIGQPVSLSAATHASSSSTATHASPSSATTRASSSSTTMQAPSSSSTGTASSGTGAAAAAQGSSERVPQEDEDTISRIKRGLEERGKPLLAAAVEGARRVAVGGEEVSVEFAPEGKYLRDTLSKPENMRLLREVCCEVLSRPVGVHVTTRAPGETDDFPLTREDEARLEQRRMRETAEGHPFVQQLLKQFRGEITEVRRVGSTQARGE
jgi:hypothetical protein